MTRLLVSDRPDPYARLRETLPRATPGPWRKLGPYEVVADLANIMVGATPGGPAERIGFASDGGHTAESCAANATYIAAVSPDVIAALLKERDVLVKVAEAAREYATVADGHVPGVDTDALLAESMRRFDALRAALRDTAGGETTK